MSIHQLLQNFSMAYRSSELRFATMMVGVILLPFVFFVNGGADASAQNTANMAWEFLGVTGLLMAALALGLLLFKRRAQNLSISTPVYQAATTDKGCI